MPADARGATLVGMSNMNSPRDIVAALELAPVLPPGTEERLVGYGVMGLPFASGHYLGLRRMPGSSVGDAFTSVWWRDPARKWVIFHNVSETQSCPRWFGQALERSELRPIDVTWTGPRALRVSIDGLLDWQIELGASPATRMMSAMGSVAPRWLMKNDATLSAMGATAGPLLGVGHLALHGQVPNGHSFKANPRQTWTVTDSQASIDGLDLGPVGPLDQQTRLGDFWLPQRGLFFAGEVYFASRRLASA